MDEKQYAVSAKDLSMISDNSQQNGEKYRHEKKASFASANLEYLYHMRDDNLYGDSPNQIDSDQDKLEEQILDEEALFEQIFKNKGAGQLSRLFSNIFFYMMYTIVTQVCLGLSVINFFIDPNDNLRSFFWILLSIDSLKAALYSWIFYKHPMLFREGAYFRLDLFSCLSYMPIYIGCIIFLSDRVSLEWLWVFVLPQFFIFYHSYRYFQKIPGSWMRLMAKIRLLEPFQNIFIFLNMSMLYFENWGLGLAYYYSFIVFLLVMSTVVAILSIVFFFFIFIASKHRGKDFLMFIYIGPIIFYLVWIGYVSYFAFMGIKHFLEIGGFTYTPISKDLLSGDLYSSAIWVVFLGLITLIWTLLVHLALRKWIVKYFMTSKYLNSLSRLSYDLNFGVKVMSDFYFKKQRPRARSRADSYKEETQLFIARNALTECIFCYKKNADVLIQPCGHAGICAKCIQKSLAKSIKCPFCDEKIKKIRTIVYDNENKVFVAKDEIVIETKKTISHNFDEF
jgi:hypothetical protein